MLKPRVEIKDLRDGLAETLWQHRVDEIESAFAGSFDQVEFVDNRALGEMARLDLAFMNESLDRVRNADGSLRDSRIFVAGAGTGREVIELCRQGADVVGVDATRRYLEITAEKLSLMSSDRDNHQIELAWCPVEQYPFDGVQFDAATSLFGVLNHVEDWSDALSRIAGSLRTGGVLVFTMYGSNQARVFKCLTDGRLEYQPSILQKRVPGGILLGEHSSDVLPTLFPSREAVESLLRSKGLRICSVVGFLDFLALFPREASSDNLSLLKEVLRQDEPTLWSQIKDTLDPDEIFARMADYDRGKSRDPERLDEFAYVGFLAERVAS